MLRKKKSDLDDYSYKSRLGSVKEKIRPSESKKFDNFSQSMREKGYSMVGGSRYQPTTTWRRGTDEITVASLSKEGRKDALRRVGRKELTRERDVDDVDVAFMTEKGEVKMLKSEPEKVQEVVKSTSQKGQKTRTKKKYQRKLRVRPAGKGVYEAPSMSESMANVFGGGGGFVDLSEAFGYGGTPMDLSDAFGYGGGPSGIFGADFLGMGYEPERKPRKRKPKRSQSGQSAGTGNQPIVIVVRDND